MSVESTAKWLYLTEHGGDCSVTPYEWLSRDVRLGYEQLVDLARGRPIVSVIKWTKAGGSSAEEWRGDMDSLFIVAVKSRDGWDLSLHDVLLEGWRISVVPIGGSAEEMREGALKWVQETVRKWHDELDGVVLAEVCEEFEAGRKFYEKLGDQQFADWGDLAREARQRFDEAARKRESL